MWLIFSPITSYHDVSWELGEAFPQGGDCHTLSEKKNQRHFSGKIAMLIETLLKFPELSRARIPFVDN